MWIDETDVFLIRNVVFNKIFAPVTSSFYLIVQFSQVHYRKKMPFPKLQINGTIRKNYLFNRVNASSYLICITTAFYGSIYDYVPSGSVLALLQYKSIQRKINYTFFLLLSYC